MASTPVKTRFKDSGSQWLGKIPESWGLKKLKFLVSCVGGGTPSTGTPEFWGGDIPWVSPKDMKCASIESTGDYLTELGVVSSATSIIDVGAVLVVVRSGILRHSIPVARNAVQVALNQDMKALIPKGAMSSSFLYWIIEGHQSQLLPLWSKPGCTVESIELGYLLNTEIPLPSADEQESIVRFLDFKTGQIDALIAKKEALLAKLAEKRVALISHAVTKGLDPSVPMKDSGVAWLGEIPAHWKIIPTKFSLGMPITDGPHSTPQFYDEGIPFLSAESVKNDHLDFNKMRGHISKEDHKFFSKKYKPKYGDVYMVKSGATTGAVARVQTHEDFNIWSPLAVLRPHSEKSLTDYLFYVLKSKPFFYSVELSWSYGTQQNIGMGVISNIRMALPPLKEQKEICEFLFPRLARIDEQKLRIESAIERVKEYRAALITNAVTGKIDVRQFALPITEQEAAHA